MSELFGRQVVVQVEDTQVTGLRCVFRVVRTSGVEPNTAEVTLYNLAETTRRHLSQVHRAQVRLSAGYTGTVGLLFSGQARRVGGVQHVRSGPDWLTRVECGDGETALTTSRITRSFAPGTSVRQVARALADTLNGVDMGNLEKALTQVQDVPFPHGFSTQSRTADELTTLLASRGLSWSIQDGRLQVLGASEVEPGQAVLLTPETGLMGSPEYNTPDKAKGPPTLKVRSLLQPSLRPGVLVQVRAAAVQGDFKVLKVTHNGDTHGPGWLSECETVARK
ncbi:phage protein [Corallococcus exiguus]|uniref:phage protein n=1 Tax=Corallococcus exiguus TaxID=83462 RepID=UPI001471BFC2|nr:hypothetical protein [Corallococcus exiguus]NNB89939.1 hypothetical protein [Corallococcus exiguus]